MVQKWGHLLALLILGKILEIRSSHVDHFVFLIDGKTRKFLYCNLLINRLCLTVSSASVLINQNLIAVLVIKNVCVSPCDDLSMEIEPSYSQKRIKFLGDVNFINSHINPVGINDWNPSFLLIIFQNLSQRIIISFVINSLSGSKVFELIVNIGVNSERI